MEVRYDHNYAKNDDDNVDFKHEIKRLLRYWPWFLAALVVSLISAYVFLRYSPRIYETYSKIKILDESEGLELPTSAFIFNRSNINLENEIEILTSYIIMNRVVRKLDLNTSFYEVGTIQTTQIDHLPFEFQQIIEPDSITIPMSYKVNILDNGLQIDNLNTDKSFTFNEFNTKSKDHRLPFNINLNKALAESFADKSYIIKFATLKNAALSLKNKIKVETIGERSDLLQLSMKGESKELSERILDTLMGVFDADGIKDRQLVSQRTLEFIADRFKLLEVQLDSIEIDQEVFKEDNNIVNITADAELGLQQRAESEQELFKIQNQITLSNLLDKSLNTDDNTLGLLPANFGIENAGINTLISEYNIAVLNRDKLKSSAGENNPAVKAAENQVLDLRSNINRSIKTYKNQLEASLNQLDVRNKQYAGRVSQIPEQERLYKAIQRQQKIKESLYLLLLQKQEEAAINLAITEPSIKIVEDALSSTNPISPKKGIIYAVAILGGLFLPIGILYLTFVFDDKLHSKDDVTKYSPNVPVIGEIPDLRKKKNIIFEDPNDRSPLAESFRILSSNVDYILPIKEDKLGRVIYCTSTIKGEGKTYISINLSLALSSINKKVLLIGADLRNPQIHTHIAEDKQKRGLSNYLHDVDFDWKDSLISGFDKHPNHHIMLSGSIPPNPAHLLTNGRFEKLIEEAKEIYDYVIVDTAPLILVTDTMLISQLADATVYLVRANYTEKNLLKFSRELHDSGKLQNMAYVLNNVGASRSYGYGYNYGYNYGYGSSQE
ncbi:GumC family protein [Winogradskyella tangerina]|uniref:GumC family protein n=1 Tax=Winogradskyella tangerina TaxID=2023240 RepID=UPI000DBE88CF|nr:polysaccharide biosynthesis tyrosine autokinase [Winogradskyella tangerina]